jgi:hypothetical protein
MDRRVFLQTGFAAGMGLSVLGKYATAVPSAVVDTSWLQTARAFRIDGYQYPLAPRINYDAEAAAEALDEMLIDTARIATMGKYSYIQGVRFTPHRDLGERDILQETIEACKPRGIRVLPYISTGNRLAVSMLTEDYPEYAQAETPGGGPRVMDVSGEDRANTCWNTPYRQAYLDLINHVIEDYEVDGLYFDAFMNAWYHYQRPHTCYCQGCREGFRKATGREIPYHPNLEEYTAEERETVKQYLAWKYEEMMTVFQEVRRRADAAGLILVTNVNNPWRLEDEDPRMKSGMDGFLYESIPTLLERAEAVSVARAAGFPIWPYVSPGDGRARQEIFTNAMFSGGVIITEQDLLQSGQDRSVVREAHAVLDTHENYYAGFENVPHVAVPYGFERRNYYASIDGAFTPGGIDDPVHTGHSLRESTQGALAACLRRHTQVSSVFEAMLEDREELHRYDVLYLADMPHLSGEMIENISSFVAGGGGLVASCSTSLYDENDKPREGFGLAEVLGVSPYSQHRSERGYLEDPAGGTRLEATSDMSVLGNPQWNLRVPVDEFVPVEVSSGARVAAEIRPREGEEEDWRYPGIVVSRYGEGTVIYLSFPLETAVLAEDSERVNNLVRNLIDYVTSRPAPYTVDGPADLMVNMTEKDSTRVIHLTNTGTPSYWPRDDSDGYYLSPIMNVRASLRIPDGKAVRSVTPLVDDEIQWEEDGATVDFVFPVIQAYQAVAVAFV